MFTVPADTPVTMPDTGSTVARAVLLLLQLPDAFLVVFFFVANNQIGLKQVNSIKPEVLGASNYSL